MQKSIEFILNKSEITAGTRGASLGPEALIAAARAQQSTLFGCHAVVRCRDWNHLLDEAVTTPFAKRIEGVIEVYKEVSEKIGEALKRDKFPIVLAGDHGSAGGTVAGIKASHPTKRLGVVWIDAHSDIHSPYTTPSGNMHGMPVTVFLGEDNKASLRNNIAEFEIAKWEELKQVGVKGAKVNPSDLVYVGVRDFEPEEQELMQRLAIVNHEVEELRSHGADHILTLIKNQLATCDHVYVSFDVDAMDPELASHGTGTPVPVGITPEEARLLLVGLASWEKTVCMEFVEINPCLDDKKNRMAEIAFSLLEEVVKTIEG